MTRKLTFANTLPPRGPGPPGARANICNNEVRTNRHAVNVVILAAGQGKRMHSDLPKVLHPLAGKPLLAHVIATARSLQPEQARMLRLLRNRYLAGEKIDLAVFNRDATFKQIGGRRKMEGLFGEEGLKRIVDELNARVFTG